MAQAMWSDVEVNNTTKVTLEFECGVLGLYERMATNRCLDDPAVDRLQRMKRAMEKRVDSFNAGEPPQKRFSLNDRKRVGNELIKILAWGGFEGLDPQGKELETPATPGKYLETLQEEEETEFVRFGEDSEVGAWGPIVDSGDELDSDEETIVETVVLRDLSNKDSREKLKSITHDTSIGKFRLRVAADASVWPREKGLNINTILLNGTFDIKANGTYFMSKLHRLNVYNGEDRLVAKLIAVSDLTVEDQGDAGAVADLLLSSLERGTGVQIRAAKAATRFLQEHDVKGRLHPAEDHNL